MTKIIKWSDIQQVLPEIDIVREVEEGFEYYSKGEVVVPPIGELIFDNPPGDVHIKYGYIINDEYFVVKIASGFYNNPELDLSSSQGLNLIFSTRTGAPEAVLFDEGNLTNIRTAAAGACVSRYMAPSTVEKIGIIGAGIQGRLQLEYLLKEKTVSRVFIYDNNPDSVNGFKDHFSNSAIQIEYAIPDEIAAKCNLIVTCTPSGIPLLKVEHIRPGMHITAVGSDTSEKQELDEKIIAIADLVVADSIAQCQTRGEIFHSIKNGLIRPDQIKELGNIISGKDKGRVNDNQISVADLTGVAVQDIQISKAVYKSLNI